MRVAVLADPASWYLSDLRRAAAGRHDVAVASFSEIRCELVKGECRVFSGELDLRTFDAVFVRTMPPGSLEQVVFRMDLLGRLHESGTLVLNPPRAVETAVDKFLTSAKLQAAGFQTPRTLVCQTEDDGRHAFETLGRDVVVKPLFGSEGRGIVRLNDPDLASRAFKMLTQMGAILYVQEFVAHAGHDLRLFVVGDRVLGMRRSNPLDWRTNVSRGATAEAFTPDGELCELAFRAAAAVGAPLAGVDFLPGNDGQLYAIEVNAVPGWKALANATGVDIAALVLDYTESQLSRRTL